METNVQIKTAEVKEPAKRGPVPKSKVVKQAVEIVESPKAEVQEEAPHVTSRKAKRGLGQRGPQSAEIEKKRERDRKMVKGIFMFKELPGGTLRFAYRAYRNDPIEKFELTDGQVYSLPYGVANHINSNMSYFVHGRRTTEIGNPHAMIGKRVQRAIFSPIEFSDLRVPGEFIVEPSYMVR